MLSYIKTIRLSKSGYAGKKMSKEVFAYAKLSFWWLFSQSVFNLLNLKCVSLWTEQKGDFWFLVQRAGLHACAKKKTQDFFASLPCWQTGKKKWTPVGRGCFADLSVQRLPDGMCISGRGFHLAKTRLTIDRKSALLINRSHRKNWFI